MLKDYFLSFPVINFHVRISDTESLQMKWYASEYLF
jgi:hypothetical protein